MKKEKKVAKNLPSAELVKELNKFLVGHANHKVNVVKDIVMVRCTQCNMAFTCPTGDWESIVTQLKKTGPDAKTVDVPVSRG